MPDMDVDMLPKTEAIPPSLPRVIQLALVLASVLIFTGCVVASEQQGGRAPASTPKNAPPLVAGSPPTPTQPGVQSDARPTAAPTAQAAASVSTVGGTSGSAVTSPLPAAGPGPSYMVAQGDSLTEVARRYNLQLVELAQINQVPADAQLRVGQELKLPGGSWSAQLGVRVALPQSGSAVRQPIVVSGSAATFESNVTIEVVDTEGQSLGRAVVQASGGGPGAHGRFESSINVAPSANNRAATVRVYWPSPRDGSPRDEVRVPITILGSG